MCASENVRASGAMMICPQWHLVSRAGSSMRCTARHTPATATGRNRFCTTVSGGTREAPPRSTHDVAIDEPHQHRTHGGPSPVSGKRKQKRACFDAPFARGDLDGRLREPDRQRMRVQGHEREIPLRESMCACARVCVSMSLPGRRSETHAYEQSERGQHAHMDCMRRNFCEGRVGTFGICCYP